MRKEEKFQRFLLSRMVRYIKGEINECQGLTHGFLNRTSYHFRQENEISCQIPVTKFTQLRYNE